MIENLAGDGVLCRSGWKKDRKIQDRKICDIPYLVLPEFHFPVRNLPAYGPVQEQPWWRLTRKVFIVRTIQKS